MTTIFMHIQGFSVADFGFYYIRCAVIKFTSTISTFFQLLQQVPVIISGEFFNLVDEEGVIIFHLTCLLTGYDGVERRTLSRPLSAGGLFIVLGFRTRRIYANYFGSAHQILYCLSLFL